MRAALVLLVPLVPLVLRAIPARAQDPVKAAPKNYTVVFENDQVRVLRAVLAPGDKTGMHEHPSNVVIPLTTGPATFTLPDGKTVEAAMTAGTPIWGPSGKHASANQSKARAEVIIVELKPKK